MNAVRRAISGGYQDKGYLPISAHKPANAAAFPQGRQKNCKLSMNDERDSPPTSRQ